MGKALSTVIRCCCCCCRVTTGGASFEASASGGGGGRAGVSATGYHQGGDSVPQQQPQQQPKQQPQQQPKKPTPAPAPAPAPKKPDSSKKPAAVAASKKPAKKGGRMAFPAGYPTGIQAPVINPTLPYEGPIDGGMSCGKLIYISGCVHDGADRFHVNLQCGGGGPPRPNVAFHFNPRFLAGKVVRNTLVDQKWGNEEKGDPGEFPFGHKENFEIVIMCEGGGYKTAVNGKPFVDYNHRIGADDLSCIDTISIDGMCDIFAIRFEAADSMPSFEFEPKIKPPVPFECPIDGGMGDGKMIFVAGFVNEGEPDRFHINLQCGPGEAAPRPNVAFHFNPRFAAQKIVRNAMADTKWGNEEKETPDFPFVPGGYFEVIILCQGDAWRAAVNGVHMVEFAHRQPCENVNTLFIKGAIRLTQVRFQ